MSRQGALSADPASVGPLSETEFELADSDWIVRFDLAGGKVLGFHSQYAEGPEGLLHKFMEPFLNS